ncbi:MAG: phosphopyruvate hydratase [Anaerolineae bacterium]|nr:phosphopyruvate hydratase [Anaerolineae bacterium]
MRSASRIESVSARQVFSSRGHPGIEAKVTTANGAVGVAVATAGISVGTHEVRFAYDGGPRWHGRGVQKAVDSVNQRIAPALIGVDAARQIDVDGVILGLDNSYEKALLGGNATAAVSAAALKAGAASLGIPLYQHIGGARATVLPVPAAGVMGGSERYGGAGSIKSGGKPSYEMVCYGFDTFSDASYAGWEVSETYKRALKSRFDLSAASSGRAEPGAGVVKHDREFWDLMTKTIIQLGYEGRVGLQVDVAAATYFDKDKGKFVGLFSAQDKSRDDLIVLYHEMVDNYPFVILEDPLDEEDYEGHAILVRELGIEIVGDDLFTTNPRRVQQGIDAGAANAVLLKVNQIGTISEAFDMVNLAYSHGYGVMPCSSRGEGADIADYTVGLNCGHMRGGAIGDTANRLLEIEAELGPRAVFAGKNGLKFGPKS